MGDKLIRFYSGDGQIEVYYLDTLDEITNYEGDPNDVLVFWFDPEKREFADITEEARAAMVMTCPH